MQNVITILKSCFLTGEGETAWLWTKIWSCPFLGLLAPWSAAHAMGREEGEMLKTTGCGGAGKKGRGIIMFFL